MNLFSSVRLDGLVLTVVVVAALQPVRGDQVITFAHYNVENYLVMDRHEHGRLVHAGKPEAEVAPLIRIIQAIHPDLLGVAEMGPPDQFESFRKRLADAGLAYSAAEYVQGADPDRHLALLSRFPILERHSEADAEVTLPDHREPMRRGILDVTVGITPHTRIRLVGAHLKSKLPIPEGEELVRRAEAQKLREHIDALLQQAPDTLLLVYGDLNDTKDEPTIREVAGIRENPSGLLDLWLADQDGDRWTYYRKFSDTYARIDYVFVNRALLPALDRAKSYLFRSPDWNRASDHRPVVATLKVAE